MCCDALGKINIFAGTEHDSTNYGKVQETFRKHTAGTANKGRAPPEGGVKYSLESYSNSRIENWKNSKRIIIYSSNYELTEFVRKSVNNKSFVGKMYFGRVGKELSKAIKEATGYNFEGKNVTIRADNVRKIIKDHGVAKKEATRGQRAISENDFINIPKVTEYSFLHFSLPPFKYCERYLSANRATPCSKTSIWVFR